ncbi:MAG: hypothetical protein GY714_17500 [Desulfobacterales bacterium]|nr:hypothetical protein [Desulfobacterales bacterium]MCP4162866.1 hypothetical protein [Deltaproteobacteria bacterium]
MKRTGDFYFDPKDEIYREHFPGNPVVPGTVIIKAFIDLLGESNLRVENFTFRKFLTPGSCSYIIDQKENIYYCKIYSGNITYAKGIIKSGESLNEI